MNGLITAHQVFLFPDTPLGAMPDCLHAAAALNGRVGIQILFECPDESGCVAVSADGFDVEISQLLPVPVEYNTGNGVDQGGAMVLLPNERPDYAIRRAPFQVLDCLKPMPSGVIPADKGRACAYVCLTPQPGLPAGDHTLTLTVSAGGQTHACRIGCTIYPVTADEDLFQTTNWFSISSMEQLHGVTRGTAAFDAVVRAYARSMRRVNQKVFLLWMHEDLSERRAVRPYHFDFEDMKPIIEIFFEEGFEWLETGGILCRGLGILHRFAGGEVGQRTQLFIDLGYVCADDDLVLLAAAHHAQHTADGFDFLILGYGVVLQVKPQPGHAVGGVFQVGSTTHSRQNMLGDLFVVCHFVFLLFMIPTGRFAGRPVDTR